MQSFTTQSHQRNYQGNVILSTTNVADKARSQRHKIITGIAVVVMALAVAVSTSLLGIVTLHNQQLEHQIQNLTTQTTDTTEEQPCDNIVPCDALSTDVKTRRRGKSLKRIPISEQQHETTELPLIGNYQTDEN